MNRPETPQGSDRVVKRERENSDCDIRLLFAVFLPLCYFATLAVVHVCVFIVCLCQCRLSPSHPPPLSSFLLSFFSSRRCPTSWSKTIVHKWEMWKLGRCRCRVVPSISQPNTSFASWPRSTSPLPIYRILWRRGNSHTLRSILLSLDYTLRRRESGIFVKNTSKIWLAPKILGDCGRVWFVKEKRFFWPIKIPQFHENFPRIHRLQFLEMPQHFLCLPIPHPKHVVEPLVCLAKNLSMSGVAWIWLRNASYFEVCRRTKNLVSPLVLLLDTRREKSEKINSALPKSASLWTISLMMMVKVWCAKNAFETSLDWKVRKLWWRGFAVLFSLTVVLFLIWTQVCWTIDDLERVIWIESQEALPVWIQRWEWGRWKACRSIKWLVQEGWIWALSLPWVFT